MISDDRELLADLAQLNSDVVPLAMRIMDSSVTSAQQQSFADRLIDIGTRLSCRSYRRLRRPRSRICTVHFLITWYLQRPAP